MKINITDEAIEQLNMLEIKTIKIILHGQGCGGPVLSMADGQPDSGDAVLKVKDVIFSLNKELIDEFETIDINYCNSLNGGFSVEADNCGGCIRCNGCWLNTINTNIITR